MPKFGRHMPHSGIRARSRSRSAASLLLAAPGSGLPKLGRGAWQKWRAAPKARPEALPRFRFVTRGNTARTLRLGDNVKGLSWRADFLSPDAS